MESSMRSMIMLKTLQKHRAHLIRKSRGSDRKQERLLWKLQIQVLTREFACTSEMINLRNLVNTSCFQLSGKKCGQSPSTGPSQQRDSIWSLGLKYRFFFFFTDLSKQSHWLQKQLTSLPFVEHWNELIWKLQELCENMVTFNDKVDGFEAKPSAMLTHDV